MKQLETITLGEHVVSVSVEHNPAYPHVLKFTAKCCEEIELTTSMTCKGQHDHTDEQFSKDVNAHADSLAREVSGICRAKSLAQRFARG